MMMGERLRSEINDRVKKRFRKPLTPFRFAYHLPATPSGRAGLLEAKPTEGRCPISMIEGSTGGENWALGLHPGNALPGSVRYVKEIPSERGGRRHGSARVLPGLWIY